MAQRTRGALEGILQYHSERLNGGGGGGGGGSEGQKAAQFFNYLRVFLGLDARACVVVLPAQFE